MGVVLIEQIGRSKRRGKLDDKYVREYSVPYRVRTSTPTDSAVVVITALQAVVPIYTPHTEDGYALLKNWSVQETDLQTCWEATAEYSTSTADPTQQAPNPLDEPADITWGSERVEIALQEDLDGESISNSAGDPFDPPLAVETGRQIVTVVKNQAFYTRTFAGLYLYHFNADSIWGLDAGQILMVQFDGKRAIKNGIVYYPWTMQFKFCDYSMTTWENATILDAGFRYLSGGVYVSINDKNGQPVSKPAPMDGGGLPLVAGADAAFLDFRIRNGANFVDLMLPAEI